MDPFKRASSGDPMAGIPSEAYNGFLEVWEEFLRKHPKLKGQSAEPAERQIKIKNITDAAMPQFSIVHRGDRAGANLLAARYDGGSVGDRGAYGKSSPRWHGRYFRQWGCVWGRGRYW